MNNNPSRLPKGWELVPIEKIIKRPSMTGLKLLQKEYKTNGKLPVIDQGTKFVGGYTDRVDLKLNCNLPVIIFGDHTRVVKFVDFDFVVGADGVKVLEPIYFNPKLFYYFVKAIDLPDKGYARHFQFLLKSYIPFPPLEAQKRIVSKLEELFSKLDAGIEYLKKTQILLKQYRQCVLKSAFEGKLTEKWREENKNKAIIDEIITEKLTECRNDETEIYHDSKIYEMNVFPKEWAWVRIHNITKKLQYGSSDKAIDDTNGIPVLRMGNIFEGKLLFDNLKYYPSDWIHLNEFLLEDGDILFNRTNSAELVGKTAVYHQPIYPKSVFASYLIRIKILKNSYLPNILSYFINSIYGKKYIRSVVSQQVGQANVNGKKLSNMPIPFIPIEEQFQILKELDKVLSITENLEKIVNLNMVYCKNLQQSILKIAFEGKLVSQDPNDEPASILIERIKPERLKDGINDKSQYKQTKLT